MALPFAIRFLDVYNYMYVIIFLFFREYYFNNGKKEVFFDTGGKFRTNARLVSGIVNIRIHCLFIFSFVDKEFILSTYLVEMVYIQDYCK